MFVCLVMARSAKPDSVEDTFLVKLKVLYFCLCLTDILLSLAE